MKTGKTGEYFKYAIGEIVLVVIGILIALQINNWNERRIEQRTLSTYYERMHEELESSRENLHKFVSIIESLANQNKNSLEIISSKNRDSLPLLRETLGALGTAHTNSFNFPIVEEFINEGHLVQVKNTQVKDELQAFSIQLAKFDNFDEAINNQHIFTIEPYINKHINYTEIALNRFNKNLVHGGPSTDFEQFYNNLEAWNIITFKLELLNSHKSRLDGFIAMVERLIKSLESEL